MSHWITVIEQNAPKGGIKLLVGTKSDLDEKRQVTFEEGMQFAQYNGLKLIETSPKEGQNVKEAFKLLGQQVINSCINEEKKQQNNSKPMYHTLIRINHLNKPSSVESRHCYQIVYQLYIPP